MDDVLCPIVVGRAKEIAQLEEVLSSAMAGQGRVVCVTGEAGIGKSRLARELVAMARSQGVAAGVGRGVPTGVPTPFRPITEAVSQLLRDRPVPSHSEFSRWLPALGSIVPALSDTTQSGGLVESSSLIQAEALIQLMRRMAVPAGLVIVLEDLHWADLDTVAVLEYFADNLSGTPVLCVVTARDDDPSTGSEVIRRLVANRSALHIQLQRLDAGLVAEMVRACLPAVNDETIARVQRAADGIPFLVEEVLASPGVPASFNETVRARLNDFPEEERIILSTAAIFGRQFDWHLVAGAVHHIPDFAAGADVVTKSLERGVNHQLLVVEAGVFSFRHALTREAILERLLPPRRRVLATAAMKALDAAHPRLDGPWRDVAVGLALQSEDHHRAAEMLIVSGRSAIARGALATAIDALRRAHELGHPEAAPLLVEALALAGDVDGAVTAGGVAISSLTRPADAAEVHIRLAHAAVAAARWSLASSHLEAAGELLATGPLGTGLLRTRPDLHLQTRAAVLEAEVALATDRVEDARGLATGVISSGAANPEVRCNALEVLGRAERLSEPASARKFFEQAYAVAQDHDLPLWQVRAMHELGTIDMFDHCGTERLIEARRLAGEFGALSTAADVDLQLAAVSHSRFELDMALEHACSALELGEQLSLGQVRAKALVFIGENASWRGDREEMERCLGLVASITPENEMFRAFAWGARGMRELFHGDRHVAVEQLGRSAEIVADLPYAEPAAFRAVWPLLLAALGDRRAPWAAEQSRRLGIDAFGMNNGLISCAEAIICGRTGDTSAARKAVRAAESDFVNATTWNDIARWLAAESAAGFGWDDPAWWVSGVGERLDARGLTHPAERCRELAAGPRRWEGLGITAREADVLNLVVQGLSNKEIATTLSVSPRTVEKHVEALLRKLDARSRTHLVAVAAAKASPPT